MLDSVIVSGIVTIIIGVGGMFAYFWASNWVLDHVFLPAKGEHAGRNINRANQIRPWLFLFPAMFALGLYLVVPVFYSGWLSVTSGVAAGGWYRNYSEIFANDTFRIALLNNMLWVLVVPAASTFFGLIAAQLTDRLSWGNIAKSLIFMPMAISFVGASLIWSFVYHPDIEIGVVNAIRGLFGAESGVTLIDGDIVDSFLLMVVLIWIQTGFAMVILSAALRGVPEETIEAAIIDGANSFDVFFKIKVPQIMGTIVVVWTTITILVLKVYDIVAAMGNQYRNLEILPTQMMRYFDSGNYGFATAISVVIMILVLPVMVWNIRQARSETR
ncbi:carbohydrate ABC transporter permease [Citreimonas salinaria]|uniref:Maltose ABC transporter membrane protein /trehalose ABC transporter membrane protein /sucrose ABC transporter membrane protein n=1 Tax=Citreimonas salinaria TaxID=321339 RepID=A0A1H3IJP7_9RHOB|nr:sugar ABC transporter permease [Citreimonas salinaria]SDY27499.1 maltose ABC transporter membrane protein /trehalose ABC transporter membrane protein /sucrose ABC transporter membrane protein [Citreimonas salinaria]